LLRALTESGQGYVAGEKLNQSWNGYLFTRKFIEIVFNSELEEKPLSKDKRVFNEMNEIYNECLKAFKSVLVFDCTNDKLNIPAYSVYIPELYSKSFLWSNIFCTSHVGDSDLIRVLGEQKISSVYNFITEKSISGIESLFFLENHNQLAEDIREGVYNLYLSYLNDKELFEYIVSKEDNATKKTSLKKLFDGVKEADISTVFSIDKNDEESFVFFHNILKKGEKSEDDYLYLIENYSRIGLLDYAVFFAEKNGFSIEEIIDEYLPLYEELLNYSKFSNMYRRSADLLRKIYRLKNDSTLLDIAKEFIESDEKTKKQLSRMIVEKEKKRIFFGLELGDKISEWRLDSVYQVGDYVYKYNFKNEKMENMPILVSIVKNDSYKSVTDNGYYLDYNIGFFNAGKKKIVSEFIDIIEKSL
ncbi:MAG TPA: hypothetical protein PLO89_09775, partial [Spirochaetota bacterium]|nr:hypothetical protein [Spirochaetota bacterium]